MLVLSGYCDSCGPTSAGADPGRVVHHPIPQSTIRIQNRIQTAVLRGISRISAAHRRSQTTESDDIGCLVLSGPYKRTLTASSVITFTLDDFGSGSGAYLQPQRRAPQATPRNRARLDKAPSDHIWCSTGRLCCSRVTIGVYKHCSPPMREPRHKTAYYLGCHRSTTKQILLLSSCHHHEQK